MQTCNMKNVYMTLFALGVSIAANAQTTVTLRNGPSNDLDALVGTKTGANEDDINYKNSPDVGCGTWTYDVAGTGKNRCFLNFDWSRIPGNATIISAELDLYSISMGWIIHGGHAGANESWIKLVTAAWDPTTVTWNNQPAVSVNDTVTIAKSTSNIQDYLNIDVTMLVQAMKTSNSWNGFAFISKNEGANGVLSFVSSNGPDSTKRPTLRITYYTPSSIHTIGIAAPKVTVYPNPSSNPTIAVSDVAADVEIELFTISGQGIGSLVRISEEKKLQVTDLTGGARLAGGVYFVRVRTSETEVTEKIVIQ